jgi:hypothetical protein
VIGNAQSITTVTRLPLLIIHGNIVCSLQIFEDETQGDITAMHLTMIITCIEYNFGSFSLLGDTTLHHYFPQTSTLHMVSTQLPLPLLNHYHTCIYFLPCGARGPSYPDVVSIGERAGP